MSLVAATTAWAEGVVRQLAAAGQDCLATRVSAEQAEHLARAFPRAEQDRVARTFWLPAEGQPRPPAEGSVLVLTAGTSDLPVAQEAANTARALGCDVDLIADVGVAGLHRLSAVRPRLGSADVVIVIAGMEGALASVVGGLAVCPVIACPTSVGYGSTFGGLAALLAMLSSCAPGVAVVGIDNGFGAGCLAHRINALAEK